MPEVVVAEPKPPTLPASPEGDDELAPRADRAATLAACGAANTARVETLGWVGVGAHAAVALVFLLARPEAPGVAHAVVERWRQEIITAHAAAGVAVAGVHVAVRAARRRVAPEALGVPVGALLSAGYLGLGAMLAISDQAVAPSVTPFVVVALAMAFVFRLPPAATVPIYAVGTGALLLGLPTGGASQAVLLSQRMNALAFAGFAAALQIVLFRGLEAEVAQRRALDAQRDRLAAAYARLQELARAADEASRTKTQFLANVSHEFRTPMNSILGLCDLLAAEVDGARTKAWVSSMKGSARALLGVLEDVLDLSRVEAGRLRVEPVPCDLRQLARDVAISFEPRLHAKALRLDLLVGDGVPERVLLDDVRVRQILVNLVGNAVKFTVRGSVRLAVDAAPDGGGACDVTLTVADTGIGIPAEDHARIFEAFTQQSGQTNRAYGGAGLGLTITRRLVELMGGRIALESAPGRGATFTVTLPGVEHGLPVVGAADADAPPADPPPSAVAIASATPASVLAELAAALRPLRAEVARTGNIDDVEALARALRDRADRLGAAELRALGDRLGEAASAFDVAAMDHHLLSFDRLLGTEGVPPPGGLS